MSEESGASFRRRNVMKKLATTAAVGAGLGASSGSASAIEISNSLERRYRSEEMLRAAFDDHAEDVVGSLREEGFVSESFDLDTLSFDVDASEGLVDPSADDGLAAASAVEEEGTFTGVGAVSTSSNGNDIALFVQPERKEAYAFVEPAGSEETLLVTENEVGTYGYTCIKCKDCCTTDWREAYYYECDENCNNCYLKDKDCKGCSDDNC